MIDREKVIKGMEQFRSDFKPFCGGKADWERFDAGLALLKEQEELLYKKQKDIDRLCNEISEWKHKFHDKSLKEQDEKPVEVCGQMFTIKYGHCPKCGEGVNSEAYPHWCGFCGQAVKWE